MFSYREAPFPGRFCLPRLRPLRVLAEIARGHAGVLFEQVAEIVGVVVAHGVGDVAGAHLRGAQKFLGLVHAQAGEVFGERHAHFLGEDGAEVAVGHAYMAGNVVEGHAAVLIDVYKRQAE